MADVFLISLSQVFILVFVQYKQKLDTDGLVAE